MRTVIFSFLCLTLLVGAATPAAGQTTPAGVRGDLIAQLDDAATKLEQLAEAIPQDKYSWRPMEGVRSVSEVLMHVAGANVYFPSVVGVQPALQMPRDAETSVTDKAQVMDYLKRSFEGIRMAIREMPDSDLDKAATLFGQQTTYRAVCLLGVMHAHEHLGQLIAYARTNQIVPPWSAGGP